MKSVLLTFLATATLYYLHVHTKSTDGLLHLFGRKTALMDTIVFAVVHITAFYLLHTYVTPMIENMGNYGATCPNGYAMQANGDCKPTGHATYEGKNY